MRTLDETAAAILEPPKGMLVLDEYAEALVPAGRFTEAVLRAEGLNDHISAVLLTAEAFATLHPSGTEPLVGVRMTMSEPDLGASSIQVNQAVTTNALLALRDEIDRAGVNPRHLLLRINMVVPGISNPVTADSEEVARRTVGLLEKGVPAETPGVLLLSGGQPLDQACMYLEAVASDPGHPWRVTFAFSRSLIAAAASAWVQDGEWERILLQSCRRASQSVALV